MDTESLASTTTRRSVGDGLTNVRVLAPGAPAYDNVTTALVEQIHKAIRVETDRKRGAVPVLFPHTLDATSLGEFMALYPEYRLVPLNSTNPVHVEWSAHRFMALHLCIDAARVYTDKLLVLGDALYQCATRDLRGAHLETDPTDAVGVHSRYASASEYVRTSKSRVDVEKNHSYRLSSVAYRDFIRGEAYQVCDKSTTCSHPAEALVVDLSMHPLTVTQACAAILTAGASFAEVFLPYTADVFPMEGGEFPSSGGVRYTKDNKRLNMVYPDGIAGVTQYPMALWAEWLKATTITVWHDMKFVDFRLELSQHRGPFMYCRLVKLDTRQMSGVTRHALEMPWSGGKYIFSYSRLRSVGSNPSLAGSWEVVNDMVPQDVVDKLYLYAMSLTQSEFTPEAILRRASKIDSRVITAGTNVRIREPMEPVLATEVAGGVFARAFVSRYETGKIGTDLISELNKVTRFSRLDRAEKLAAVFAAVSQSAFYDTFISSTRMEQFRNYLVGYLTGKSGLVRPTFVKPPKFLLLEEHNKWLLHRKRDAFALVYGGHVNVPALRGGETAVHSAFRLGKMKTVELDLTSAVPSTVPSGELHDDIVDTSQGTEPSKDVKKMVQMVSVSDDVTRDPFDKFSLSMQYRTPEVKQGHEGPERYDRVEDIPGTINDVADRVFVGLADQDFELDAPSMMYDAQHRDYQAEYMEHPLDDPVTPATMRVFKSKVTGYNIERKAQTLQETLTSLGARNLAAPAMRVESDETATILTVWDKMMSTVFSDDTPDKLESFRTNKVGFEEELLAEWGMKAKPENVGKVLKMLMEGVSFEDATPWVFDIIMKGDGKPPLSTKPLKETIPSQLIAMNDKFTGAMLSSIFRVMSRRFVSLLKPSIMVNLLKDTAGVVDHIAANHPWGDDLVFLENDFSKFDKSQDRFSYMLMQFVMQKLGFDDELLDRWIDANERCSLRSMALGIILASRYQNKSGSAATSLMNAVVNICAVVTCYAGTCIVWAAFMGDDSIVACRQVVATLGSLQKMAEIFNFEAKFFVLRYPYFTSCPILFDVSRKKVFMPPDPIKKCQRYSVSVSAANPAWQDKARSANESLVAYRHAGDLVGLSEAMRERYGISPDVDLRPLFDALATLSSSEQDFRSLYDETETILPY